MNDHRRAVLDWAEAGHLPAAALPRALSLAGVLPNPADWRRFLDRLLLWLGAILLAAALVFFLAYNWREMGRYAKFGLAEAALFGALAGAWTLGLERPAGRAALFSAALLVGALLALIGQTYQTGADPYELFATWALMILPWALLARSAPLWLLWVGLVNLAIALYFRTVPNVFGVLLSLERMLWLLLAVDTAALLIWEAAAARGITWLQPRWAPRLLATAAGSVVTALALMAVFDGDDVSVLALPAWLAWWGAAWAVYRYRLRDLYVLAGGVLSGVVVIATFAARHLGDHDAGGFLLVSLIVVGLSAAGGWWLRQLARELEA